MIAQINLASFRPSPRHGITFAHYGSCAKELATAGDEAKCPKSCSKRSRSRDGPVCGSDGNVYPSQCEMRKRTCG